MENTSIQYYAKYKIYSLFGDKELICRKKSIVPIQPKDFLDHISNNWKVKNWNIELTEVGEGEPD